MKRAELLAVVLSGMIFTYLVGYYDGSHTRHHTTTEELFRQ